MKKLNMLSNKPYRITKEIKIHTKPLNKVQIIREGMFIKETSKSYVFDGFRVNKANVIKVEKI